MYRDGGYDQVATVAAAVSAAFRLNLPSPYLLAHNWRRGGISTMKTSMGEYLVGAYLKQLLGCDVVDYNVRPSSTGLSGLAEFDVVGLRFADSTAYVCEVITHLGGIQYGNNQATIKKIKEKFEDTIRALWKRGSKQAKKVTAVLKSLEA